MKWYSIKTHQFPHNMKLILRVVNHGQEAYTSGEMIHDGEKERLNFDSDVYSTWYITHFLIPEPVLHSE